MSFYTSLNGIKNAQTSLNVVSNNIANSETTGFKNSRVIFADVVAGTAFTNPRLIEGIGAKVESITQNFKQGPMDRPAPRSIWRSAATVFSPPSRPPPGKPIIRATAPSSSIRRAPSSMARTTASSSSRPMPPAPSPARP
jgi:hypothetical protein